MIRFTQVTLIRGVKTLLESADLTLNPGDKVGLIGINGAGKSSLFNLLRDQLQVDQGSVDFPSSWRIAYVAQETPPIETAAIEYAIDGDTTLRRLEAELVEAEKLDDGERIGYLYAALSDADAYTVRSRAQQLLIGLGFRLEQLDLPVSSFSGGWRMRLNLAQALMCPSDLLLLDEPTNHLDLDAIIWLESWLKSYTGTLVIISHDRDFLDGIVNVIAHIDDKKIKRYSGNYSSFERQRAAALILAAGSAEKQMRKRAHLQSFIDRFKAKASKAKQAQSRIKMLSKMQELAPLHEAASFSFDFREPPQTPNPLLVMDNVCVGYQRVPSKNSDTINPDSKPILRDINFSLQPGQRYGLLGVNGAGKSTLIKTMACEIEPLSGSIIVGKGLVIGYFAQHQLEMLDHRESPLWHLVRIAPSTREQELRNFLGSFNFVGDMATSAIAPFSGGEKARLALALIVWQRPNLLLLDEPTNHLDLETREALTLALSKFEGTMILVSHDRHLLRATTDQFIVVSDGKLEAFDGDLDDYRDWLFKTKLDAKKQNASVTSKTTASLDTPRRESSASTINNSTVSTAPAHLNKAALEPITPHRTDSKKYAVAKKSIETRIQRIEKQLAQLEQRKKDLEVQLSEPDIYQNPQQNLLKDLLHDQAQVAQQQAILEAEWLEQQQALEQ